MKMTKFYTLYDLPPEVVSPSGGKSLTDQTAKDDTDIDKILHRYHCGDTSVSRGVGVYADVSTLGDFASAMAKVKGAQEDFNALPASIRQRFGDSPIALFEFLKDEKNYDEAVRLGLCESRKVSKSLSEEIVEGVTKSLAASSTAKSVSPQNT